MRDLVARAYPIGLQNTVESDHGIDSSRLRNPIPHRLRALGLHTGCSPMSFVAVYLGLALSVVALMVLDLNLKNGIFQ